MPTPLSALTIIASNLPGDLANLGFTSVEQALSTAQIATPEMSAFLGVDLTTIPLPRLEAIPPDLLTIINNAIYSFGVPAPAVFASYTPGAGLSSPSTAPGVKSLVADMSPVRSQGGRRTCSAFSSIAVFEHNVRKYPAPFGSLLDLSDCSEQWLYYRCKKADGNSDGGTSVSTAYKVLLNDGTVPEVDWPYQPNPTAAEDGGPPLAVLPEPALLVIGTTTRIKESRALNGTSVADFRSAIESERAVTFWVPAYDSWSKNPWAKILGQITMPVPGETSKDAHAMCAVGYIDQPEFPEIGGGRFIVRNSWGEEWGLLNPWSDRVTLPRGYGTIPYAYITNFGQEAYIIQRGPFE